MNDDASNALCSALYRADILSYEQRSLLIALLDRWPKTNADANRYRWLRMNCRSEQEATNEPQLIHSATPPNGEDWQQFLDAQIDWHISELSPHRRTQL